MTTDDLKARLAKVKVGDEVTMLTKMGCKVWGKVEPRFGDTSSALVLDIYPLRDHSGKMSIYFTDLIDHTPAPPRLPTDVGSHVILNDGSHAVIERPDSEYPWRVLGTLSHGSKKFIEDRGVTRVIWPEGWEL